MTQTWNNIKGEPSIEITIDETEGITLKVNKEEKAKHSKEIEELQTLNMYPPKDEEKIAGTESPKGNWTTYEMKKGKNWDYAKKDIVNTCEFWINNDKNNASDETAPLVVME